MASGVIRETPLSSDQPGGAESRHLNAQAHERFTMVIEVVGIAHAIAPDVRADGIFGIRPPVVTFGEVIMRTAGAAGTLGRGDGDRGFGQVGIGRL